MAIFSLTFFVTSFFRLHNCSFALHYSLPFVYGQILAKTGALTHRVYRPAGPLVVLVKNNHNLVKVTTTEFRFVLALQGNKPFCTDISLADTSPVLRLHQTNQSMVYLTQGHIDIVYNNM